MTFKEDCSAQTASFKRAVVPVVEDTKTKKVNKTEQKKRFRKVQLQTKISSSDFQLKFPKNQPPS